MVYKLQWRLKFLSKSDDAADARGITIVLRTFVMANKQVRFQFKDERT